MPQEIRILQIADLLIEDDESAKRVSKAIQDYRKKIKPEDAPDYLVVCGNITKSGEQKHFDAARKILGEVRDTLFPQAHQFPHNRVFIVPGARDLPKLPRGDRDSERFGNFYRDFYSGVPSSFEQFSPSGAIVRSLVDLTLIGICYHMDVDPEPAIATVLDAIQKAKDRAVEWNYSVSMPVILVSSFPSMLSRDGSARERQFAEKWKKKDEFGLTSHLVGGPVTFIGKEPFQASSHLTFGTGPLSPEERWSGRINVISIYPRDWWVPREHEPNQETDGVRRESGPEMIAVTAHKWPDSITGPMPSYPLFGGRRVNTNRKSVFVFDKIEADLLKLLNDNRAIAVTGLPGKGKSQVYDHCQSQSTRYACERLEQQSDRDGLLERLRAQVDRPREAPPIVVIHDNVPRREPSRAQSDSAETIVETLRKIAALKLRGIYLFPYAVRRPMLPQGFGFYDLPALDDKVMGAFKDLYTTRIPIKRSHLDRLINGYLGFAWVLFEEAKRIIEDQWPGARPIEAGTSWTLILEALTNSYDLWQLTDRFFAALRDEAGAGELRDFLVMQLADRLAAHGQTERLLDPLEFTAAEVCLRLADSPLPPRPKDVEAAALTLSKARVLEPVGSGSYRLLELIPFLVHALTNVGMPVASDLSSDASRVFVSYSHDDTDRIRPMVQDLREDFRHVWWDEDLIGGTVWDAGLDRELMNSDCILLFLTASSSSEDSFVLNEGLRCPEKVIPVMLEPVQVPLSFQKIQYVSLIGWNGEKSSPQWKALIKAIMNKIQSARRTAA